MPVGDDADGFNGTLVVQEFEGLAKSPSVPNRLKLLGNLRC